MGMSTEDEKLIEEAMTIMDTHERMMTKRRKHVATHVDHRKELRHLVKQHKALTKVSVAMVNMSSEHFSKKTGDVIPCNLPDDVQIVLKRLASNVTEKKAKSLETAMLQQLRKIPIYKHFLENVFGVGPVTASYLISEIDVAYVKKDKDGVPIPGYTLKSSGLRRFCGLAVFDGRLERHTAGVKSGYCSEIRTRLYQAFNSMWRNGRGKGRTCKYLDIWVDAKNRKLQTAVDGKVNNGERLVSASDYSHGYGWHKAADILIEDLYTVWRTLEGLEVWPSYYAAKLGYEHGGKISVNAPKKLTLDEALALVGDVSGRPHVWPSSVDLSEAA